ncbi:MAG: ThiF family adenylyltransferase, partial [Actinomycetota bacterium]|nr:ThiF family adenylyltransferase [Actinomycetota bacterium]
RAAVPRIAGHLGRPAPRDPRWRTHQGRQAVLDLTRYQVNGPVAAGEIDIISGGAITSAALYALLRMPAVTASLRIIDPDVLTLPNYNRYALARRSMLGSPKVHALAAWETSSITITGHQRRLDETTATRLGPLAPRLLVGVDHIPSRWTAQRAAPGSWICVGASSHDYVLVSAHPPGAACAGCVHTRDDQAPGDIPTVSFVSFWAGLLQALELLASAAGRSPASARSTHLWPFGLENPRGIHHFAQAPAARCPVGCPASTARRPA